MAAYVLVELDVHDPETYEKYVEAAAPIVRRHGGEYVLRSENITPVAGSQAPQRIVLIRFGSKREIRKCFTSRDYVSIKHLRENSTKSRAMIIEE